MVLDIGIGGDIRFVYDDSLVDLLHCGKSVIKRASNVEPVGDKWQADLSPVGGSLSDLFCKRSEAIEFEIDWIEKNVFGVSF